MAKMMRWAVALAVASGALSSCTNAAENRSGGDGRGTISPVREGDGDGDIEIDESPERERVRSHRVEGGSEPGAGQEGGPGVVGGGGTD